eukprot:4222028-Amphidinium_carterae.1
MSWLAYPLLWCEPCMAISASSPKRDWRPEVPRDATVKPGVVTGDERRVHSKAPSRINAELHWFAGALAKGHCLQGILVTNFWGWKRVLQQASLTMIMLRLQSQDRARFLMETFLLFS